MTMMTGTTVAQAIPIVVAPILTRLYSPKDFGVFALFAALSAILSLLATGRYEIALLLPRKNDDAVNIAIVSVIIALTLSCLLLPITLLFDEPISAVLSSSSIKGWLFLIPIMVLLSAIYQVLDAWSNRLKKFKRLALNRLLLSIAMAVANLLFGWMGWGVKGLILGALVGQVTAAALLIVQVWRGDSVRINAVSLRELRVQAIKYSSFPKYSIAADLISTLTNQLPVVLLLSMFGSYASGLYALMHRVLAKPVSIISDSVKEVFKQRASKDYAVHGNCADIFVKTSKKLIPVSIAVFAVFFIAAPSVFGLVFGAEWREAGEFARILCPVYCLRFIVVPLGYVLYIAQRQKYDLIWQASLLLMTLAGLYAGYLYESVYISLVSFALAYCVMYVFYGLLSYKFAKSSGRSHPVRPGLAEVFE